MKDFDAIAGLLEDADAWVGLLEDPDVWFTVLMGCDTLDEAELRAIALAEAEEEKE